MKTPLRGTKTETTEHLTFLKDTDEIDIEELLLFMSECDKLGTKINNLFGMLKENEWDKLFYPLLLVEDPVFERGRLGSYRGEASS